MLREKMPPSFAIKFMILSTFSHSTENVIEVTATWPHLAPLLLHTCTHECTHKCSHIKSRVRIGIRAIRRPSTNIVMWVMNGRVLNKHGGRRSYLKLRARTCKWRHLFRRSFAGAPLFLRIPRASFRFRGGHNHEPLSGAMFLFAIVVATLTALRDVAQLA